MSAFSYEVRVLLCPQCGAPIEVSPAGGATPCRFCGAHAQVAVRDDSLDDVLRPPRPPMAEGQRLSVLRGQTGKALVPPGSISHLFDSGSLAVYRLDEAIRFWQGARREAQASGQYEAAEAVYYLAMALAAHYGLQNDAARQRAVLESSLEALTLPRHRQALRCMLSRLACRSGDVAAGEQWLAPCDPASEDIEVDTPYRFSRAVLATARRDWQGVLTALGRGVNDVPIMDAMASTCVVFRANAVERMGDVDGAARALTEHGSHRPDHVAVMEKTCEAWSNFELCAGSRGRAQAAQREEKASVASASRGGPVGIIFAVLGTAMGVIGAGLLVTALVVSQHSSASPLPRRRGSAPPSPNAAAAVHPAATLGLTIAGGTLFLMGLMFSAIGYPLANAASRARRLALDGERGSAEVQAVKATGMLINNVPQYAITLLVQRAGGAPPYTATTRVLGAHAVVGTTVPVVVDPEDPTCVMLDLA